eukprot:697101-Amphidinium_carterae.1
MNARQILKEFGQEHLVGVEAQKMVKDILYQQSVKHHYANETRVSASENRDLDEYYIILDDGEAYSTQHKELNSWAKMSSLENKQPSSGSAGHSSAAKGGKVAAGPN